MGITKWQGFFDLSNFYLAKLFSQPLQSLPIQMRATILYLSNLWMDFKMLFTTNIFLYLVKVLLLTCPLISQFIAHFWSICPFLCTASFTILIIIQVRAASKHTLPLLPLLPQLLFVLPFCEWQAGCKYGLGYYLWCQRKPTYHLQPATQKNHKASTQSLRLPIHKLTGEEFQCFLPWGGSL